MTSDVSAVSLTQVEAPSAAAVDAVVKSAVGLLGDLLRSAPPRATLWPVSEEMI